MHNRDELIRIFPEFASRIKDTLLHMYREEQKRAFFTNENLRKTEFLNQAKN